LWQARFDRVKGGLRSETMAARIGQGEDRLRRLERALAKAPGRTLDRLAERLTGLGKLLRSYSYQETLARGFALVRDREGRVVRDADSLAPGDAVRLDFHDGSRHAAVTDGDEASASAQPLKAQPVKTRRAKRTGEQAGKATGDGGSRQGSLF
ncbi:MAG: exodeoxyribonuclease VII large subunit, partial [Alphaproteobacteria bacterium]